MLVECVLCLGSQYAYEVKNNNGRCMHCQHCPKTGAEDPDPGDIFVYSTPDLPAQSKFDHADNELLMELLKPPARAPRAS